MKDHKKVQRYVEIYELEGPLNEAIKRLRKEARGLIEPTVHHGWDGEIIVQGWRPMTEAELEGARRRREGAAKGEAIRAAKQRAKDEKEYERLKAKLGKSR
jgi:hypothetical protein